MFYLPQSFRHSLTVLTLAASGFSVSNIPANAQTITHFPLYTFVVDNDDAPAVVSGLGDVNGDGFADFIIGSRDSNSLGSSGNGSARVFSGIDGSGLYAIQGNNEFDSFGNSVSGVGDINQDGFDDFIVAAVNEANGRVRVFSGLDRSILQTFDGGPVIGLNSFGTSVSGAGDVDGDGFNDVIIGTPNDLNLGFRTGNANVFSGANGSVLYTFNADRFDDSFGESVSGAGDVNNDGFADLIVGAPDDDNNGNLSGSARVLSGVDGSELYTFNGNNSRDQFGSSVSGAGDVNNDGFDDMIVGDLGNSARVFSGLDGSELHTFVNNIPEDRFGVSVSGAGDVNDDGFADLIVGSTDIFGVDSRVRVYSGIDGNLLYVFENPFGFVSSFGLSVSGIGDVNGDGVDDFIVGSMSGFARVFASQVSPLLLGDLNGDQVINFLDITPFIEALSTGTFQDAADIDRNGVVNFLDIAPFIALLSVQ